MVLVFLLLTHLCQKENQGFFLRIFPPGAGYDDSTAGYEKEDDAVSPGGYYEYVWDISPNDGPTSSDPECLTYSYSSQVDPVRDVNSGLIGALLICKTSQWGLVSNNYSRSKRKTKLPETFWLVGPFMQILAFFFFSSHQKCLM